MKDILIRAIKTFWQTALAYIIINSEVFFTDILSFNETKLKQFAITIGLGALSAGLSAMYNGVLKPIAESLRKEWDGID